MFEILFIDLDDTILDFKKAEKVALEKTLRGFGLEPTAAVCQRYHEINKAYWEALERKEVTREQVLVGRFETLFGEMQIAVDPVSVAEGYKSNLGIGHYFLPGAEDAVKSLSKKYRLFLASNGTTTVQQGRIASAGIAGYFENIFISRKLASTSRTRDISTAALLKFPTLIWLRPSLLVTASLPICWAVRTQESPPAG